MNKSLYQSKNKYQKASPEKKALSHLQRHYNRLLKRHKTLSDKNMKRKYAIKIINRKIKNLDKLWFSFGNAINDCFKDKDYKKAKKLFDRFYVKYKEEKLNPKGSQ